MRKFVLVSTVLAAVCLSGALSAADWPRFLGPTANGFAPDTKINKNWAAKPPKVLWTVPLSDNGFAGPSVGAGKVFVIDHAEGRSTLRAINIKTGKDVWTYSWDDKEGDNWGFDRSTPTFDNGLVYAQSRFGILTCLNAATGKVVWSHDLIKDFGGRKPGWNYSYSPVIDGDRLVVLPGGEKAGIVAMEKKTGKVIWQNGGNIPSYSTPVVATIQGKKQYLVFDTVALQGIDPANGNQLWNFPWKTGADCNAAMPIVIGNSVFITAGYGHGCEMVDITAEGAKSRYANKDIMAHFSTPILYKGYLYGAKDGDNLVCMDPKDGSVKWSHGGFGKCPTMAADGALIAASAGNLIMVNLSPDSYQELGRIQPLEGDCWTAPIMSDGKLIARDKKKIVCLDLK